MAPGVRLTRRGRLVLLALLLACAGAVFAVAAPASDAAGPPAPRRTVIVLPGDTLWALTERYLPSRDAPAVVDEIRRLNHLDDYTIHAGQRLVLPQRGRDTP